MTKQNLADILAANMQEVMSDKNYKDIFSTSATLEKLAFKKVSEENQKTEVEQEIEKSLEVVASTDCDGCKKVAVAGKCSCECKSKEECSKGCPCKCSVTEKVASAQTEETFIKNAYTNLIAASENFEAAGMDKLSALSLMLLDKLIVEAKAKKDKKDKKPAKKDDKNSKSDKKSKDSKTSEKNKKSEKDKKDSKDNKKSSK